MGKQGFCLAIRTSITNRYYVPSPTQLTNNPPNGNCILLQSEGLQMNNSVHRVNLHTSRKPVLTCTHWSLDGWTGRYSEPSVLELLSHNNPATAD